MNAIVSIDPWSGRDFVRLSKLVENLGYLQALSADAGRRRRDVPANMRGAVGAIGAVARDGRGQAAISAIAKTIDRFLAESDHGDEQFHAVLLGMAVLWHHTPGIDQKTRNQVLAVLDSAAARACMPASHALHQRATA